MGVKDEGQAVEEADPVRGRLRVRVEDREAVFPGNESLERSQVRRRPIHGAGEPEPVLGIAADTLLKKHTSRCYSRSFDEFRLDAVVPRQARPSGAGTFTEEFTTRARKC